MNSLIKTELKKAIKSKFFLLGLTLMLLFSVLSGIYMIENRATYNPENITSLDYFYKNGKFQINPDLPAFSKRNGQHSQKPCRPNI